MKIVEKDEKPAIIKTGERKEFPVNEIKEEKIINPVTNKSPQNGLQLEVKPVLQTVEKEGTVVFQSQNRNNLMIQYLISEIINFQQLDLLETHGSEKIVQDVTELETNKNQIINTLKNYDIEIQKIYATVAQQLPCMKLCLHRVYAFHG